MKKLTSKIKIPRTVKRYLKKIKPYSGGEWDLKDNEIVLLKKVARKQLTKYQNGKCAYCGLNLDSRAPEIEHIAPKGGGKRPKHVEYTFLPINLVMACRDCNSPKKKGQKETIDLKARYYHQCEFNIVHPYLDDPNDFFDFIKDPNIEGGVIPIPKQGEPHYIINKAKNTIHMFGLDTGEKILALTQERLYEKRTPLISAELNKIINEIMAYRP